MRHAVLLLTAVCAVASPLVAQSVGCAAQTDRVAMALLDGIRYMASDTSDGPRVWRANLRVPITPRSSVVFVQSDSVCNAAALALRAHIDSTKAPVPTWVYTLGPDPYIAFDKTRSARHAWILTLFDTAFVWQKDFH